MILQTHKIESLYFVKNPYRRDLDSFCTSQQELISLLDNNTLSHNPIVYEVHFWLAVPKFKKLSIASVKKIKKETLSENCFKSNKSTKAKPIERQNKRELLAERSKKILNAAQLRRFNSWIKKGNAVQIKPNVYLEQTTQYKQEFTLPELQRFFKREFT